MTAAEALNATLAGMSRRMDAENAQRRIDTLNKLRAGHKFALGYGQQLVNQKAQGRFTSDPEMSQAISQWLWLTAEKDRMAAERAERVGAENAARMRPSIDAHTYAILRGEIESFYTFFSEARPLPLVRRQFSAWIETTKDKRASLNPAQRRSIAACQGAFNRRLRKYELLSLRRAGVCP